MKVLHNTRIWSLIVTGIVAITFNFFAESQTAWQIKAKALKHYSPNIGPLNGVVRTNNFLHGKNLEGTALTFGDSQVGSVFSKFKQGQDNINWTFIPSTSIPCYKYFLDDIIESNPSYVMLHLSDINITNSAFFIPLKYHNFSITEYICEHWNISRSELIFPEEEFKTILSGEIIKPLKESVFLKSYVNKKFFTPSPGDNRKVKSYLKSNDPPQVSDTEKENLTQDNNAVAFDINEGQLKKEVKRLIDKRSLSKHKARIDYNTEQLTKFCEALHSQNIETYIIDSQYHPDAYDYIGPEVDRPSKLIESFCKKYDYIHHIPLKSMTKLDASMYIDYIHYTKEGGKVVRNEIAQYFNEHRAKNESH